MALVATGAAVAMGFGLFAYPVLLPAIEEDLLDSHAAAGFLGTVSLVAYLAGVAATSAVARSRVPLHRVMAGGLGVCTVGMVGLSAAPTAAAVAGGLILTGLGTAAVWVPAPAVVTSVVAPARHAVALGILNSAVMVGFAANGPLTAAVRAVAGEGAWRPVYAVEAAIAATAVAGLILWLRPGEVAGDVSVAPGGLRQVPQWRYLVVAYCAYGLGYSLFVYYFAAALEDDHGFDESAAASYYTLLGLAGILGGVVAGRLCDRLGRGRTLALASAGSAAAVIGVLTGRSVVVAAAALLYGMALSAIPVAASAHIADHLEVRAISMAFAALTMAFGLVQLTGPQLGGLLVDLTSSFTAVFVLSGCASVVGAIAALGISSSRTAGPDRLVPSHLRPDGSPHNQEKEQK